ncbi:hypothetical protein V2H77_18720 [Photorhabdus sp. P32]|uniref:hypothetical protein n=1 Tax=Photorhabdus sp. P32 TaxID=3117549 RepID=UPI00311ADB00
MSVFDMFASMSIEADRAINGSLRLYIDGMQSPQYKNEVLYNQPRMGETFKDYVSRTTDGRKLGIIVNDAEQWSDRLARMGARIFAPITDALISLASQTDLTLNQRLAKVNEGDH